MARLVSAHPVARDTRNRAPVFEDQDSDTPGTQNQTAMREVAENTKANVGSAVIAEDPDPNVDPLTYALSGAHAGLFTVTDADLMDNKGGQIKVKSGTKLDFEDRTTYMVTLTATDSFGDSASIDVTIMVTDVDEAPEIMVGPATGLTVSGPTSESYAENGTGPVATYTASGPDAASATWTLGGDDAGDFNIAGGVLTFASVPDYENPTDADTDNVYMVTVEADDGTYDDTHEVTVTVTDVDEQQPTNVVDQYDTDNSGRIDRSELADGVFDYEIGRTISKGDLADLIFSYEIG